MGWGVGGDITTSNGIFKAAMMPVGTHIMAHAILVGGGIALHWSHCSSHDWVVSCSQAILFSFILRQEKGSGTFNSKFLLRLHPNWAGQ